MRKAHPALASAGTVVVNSPFPDEARRDREFSLLVAMWLFATSEGGDIYTFSEYRRFLEEVGFVSVTEVNEQPVKAVGVTTQAEAAPAWKSWC